MAQYIDKDALVAEIKERIETYNKGYANGDDRRADALEVLLHDIGTLEVKGADLNEEIESYFKGFGKFASVGIDDCIDIAKHFYELGARVTNPIVTVDRDMVEQIVIFLKRIEKDYHIDLSVETAVSLVMREMERLGN